LNPFIAIPVLLFSVVVHECAHGLTAYRAGDPTAYNAGRITLNPIPHIDLFGSIILPVLLVLSNSGFFIAWAKPVPVNPSLFSDPKRDEMRVSLAGPLSNMILALGFTAVGIIISFLFPLSMRSGSLIISLYQLCEYGIFINLLLAFFNLIPVFPLDGSHILASLLPPHLEYSYRKLSQFGFIILLVLIMTPLIRIFLTPAILISTILNKVWNPFY
jgi:Zn-dependent protease